MVFEARDYPFHPERLRAIIRGFGDYVPDAGAEGEAKAAEEEGKGEGKGKGAAKKDGEDNPMVPTEEDPFRGVFRTKGHVWLANANAYPLDWQTAGKGSDACVRACVRAFSIDPSVNPSLMHSNTDTGAPMRAYARA